MIDVTAGTGRSLYICGVPGTGKTATTMEVVQRYKDRPDTKVLNRFTQKSEKSVTLLVRSAELLKHGIGQRSLLCTVHEPFWTRGRKERLFGAPESTLSGNRRTDGADSGRDGCAADEEVGGVIQSV